LTIAITKIVKDDKFSIVLFYCFETKGASPMLKRKKPHYKPQTRDQVFGWKENNTPKANEGYKVEE